MQFIMINHVKFRYFFKIYFVLLGFTLIAQGVSAQVIHKERSLYRNILVDEESNIRCLKFDEKSHKTRQSCMYINNKKRLVFNYTKLLFSSLLVTEKLDNILIIGLGGGTMSNALHELYPSAHIHNVEIDPAVIKVAKAYFYFQENEQVVTTEGDGRIFVKRAKIKPLRYDLIILDAFNGDYIPEHLMTAEFHQELKQLLTPQGIVAANTFAKSKLYAYESATYFSVWGDFYQVSYNDDGNRIILASANGFSNEETLYAKAQQLNNKLIPYDINILDVLKVMSFTQGKHDWAENTPLLTDQFSPANLLNK